MSEAEKWLPQPEIDRACADISYRWASSKNATLTVVMHFSRVVGGLTKDLEIDFGRPLAVAWEDESFGIFESPDTLPKCAHEQFKRWPHPTLVVRGSRWRDSYADRKYAANDPESAGVTHYFLLSMNDLLHVLTEFEPKCKWVSPD